MDFIRSVFGLEEDVVTTDVDTEVDANVDTNVEDKDILIKQIITETLTLLHYNICADAHVQIWKDNINKQIDDFFKSNKSKTSCSEIQSIYKNANMDFTNISSTLIKLLCVDDKLSKEQIKSVVSLISDILCDKKITNLSPDQTDMSDFIKGIIDKKLNNRRNRKDEGLGRVVIAPPNSYNRNINKDKLKEVERFNNKNNNEWFYFVCILFFMIVLKRKKILQYFKQK